MDFRIHMVIHLLLGMIAPLGLVLAAPVTLTMRALPPAGARRLSRFLHSWFVRVVSHPVVAALLSVGAMYLLYMTPLDAFTLQSSGWSALVHWHFLAAGCLFVWAIAGPDPAPRRPSRLYRLVVLFLAVGAHATLGKLMYAYGWPRNVHSVEDVQAGAQLMYYGGDVAELLLIIAFFASWFRRVGDGGKGSRRSERKAHRLQARAGFIR